MRLGNGSSTATVTDDNGNNWVRVDRRSDTGGGSGDDLELWYALNASASPNAQPTLTIHSSLSASIRAVVAEFAGIQASAALDQHATAIGTSAASSVTTSGPLAQANELVLGYGEVENMSTFTAASGYTMVNIVPTGSGAKLGLEYLVSPTASTQTAAFSLASQAWAMGIATYR